MEQKNSLMLSPSIIFDGISNMTTGGNIFKNLGKIFTQVSDFLYFDVNPPKYSFDNSTEYS